MVGKNTNIKISQSAKGFEVRVNIWLGVQPSTLSHTMQKPTVTVEHSILIRPLLLGTFGHFWTLDGEKVA